MIAIHYFIKIMCIMIVGVHTHMHICVWCMYA